MKTKQGRPFLTAILHQFYHLLAPSSSFHHRDFLWDFLRISIRAETPNTWSVKFVGVEISVKASFRSDNSVSGHGKLGAAVAGGSGGRRVGYVLQDSRAPGGVDGSVVEGSRKTVVQGSDGGGVSSASKVSENLKIAWRGWKLVGARGEVGTSHEGLLPIELGSRAIEGVGFWCSWSLAHQK
ncbi:hypothetical protein COLO4_05840 [Corchorus olitorius]|uniref:Uncharacterized protein n=1 Tax=Corchorus olitorius TaxID=93759 RepID=A0A1R3KPQ8_9ROSI|nr:hypothetical protein COLO4_05840 [Corchorus olitorius]